MSTDKDLIAEDYRDASRRYKECSSMAVRRRQIEEVAAEFDSFIRSPTGLAALDMLATSEKVIVFATASECDDGYTRVAGIYQEALDGRGKWVSICNGDRRCSDRPLTGVVEEWMSSKKGREPKDFLPWLKAELKKIHDDAPGGRTAIPGVL